MKTLSEKDVIDFIYGASVYGTGGGGSVESAMSLLQDAKDRGIKFKLVDPLEVPDDEIVACPYGVGGGVSEEIRKRFASLPRLPRHEIILIAVKEFEKYLGKQVYGFIPGELGAGNSLLAMYLAALTDRYTVDGDTVGRSVPEVAHSTFTICDVPITPFVITTPSGDSMLVTRVLNDQRAEDIDRFMAIASGGGVTVIDHPVDGKTLRNSIVPNTVTKSIEVGRSVRAAREKGSDLVDALLESTKGHLLFQGKISMVDRENRDGFIWGSVELKGLGTFQENNYKVWFKNENLMTWMNGKPHVTCPDLVSIVDADTCHALSNWGDDLTEGRDVIVLGIRAPDIWRTARGLELLTPKYFGYDVKYRPIEDII